MSEFLIETGLEKHTFTGVGVGSIDVFFNPTDVRFAERIFNAVESIAKKQESYEEKDRKIADHKARFVLMDEVDADIRTEIDGIFDAPLCEAVFGNLNVMAYASGMPIGISLLMQVIEGIDTAYAREQKMTNPRVQKYLDKYKNRK